MSVLVGFTTLIGLLLDDIAIVVDLVGSVCGVTIAFVFPTWAYYMLFPETRRSVYSLFSGFIFVLGLVLVPLGAVLAILYA